MSQAVLFKLLLAEIALQRGQNNVAVQSFLELWRARRIWAWIRGIAQRATEVAWNARFLGVPPSRPLGIWLAADPESQQARADAGGAAGKSVSGSRMPSRISKNGWLPTRDKRRARVSCS